jgi:hypothetical protein
MDDIYQAIYKKLRHPRDAVRFSTLSRSTKAFAESTNQRMFLTVTSRSREHGILDWIHAHGAKVKGLTFKRCVHSPLFLIPSGVETLRFFYCRVFPRSLQSLTSSLKHLTVHQIMAGSDPGCMTPLLNACRSLETLSLTCASEWGVVAIGPLHLPRLTHLMLRNPSGEVIYHHGTHDALQCITLHSADMYLPPGEQFPSSCSSLSLHSTDSFILDLEECIPKTVRNLDLVTKGIPSPFLLPRLTDVTTFTCQSDSFILGSPLPRSLERFEVNVTLCFVIMDMDPEDADFFKKIAYTRTTERYRVVDLIR